jgi:predicted HTH transcriptional regulator
VRVKGKGKDRKQGVKAAGSMKMTLRYAHLAPKSKLRISSGTEKRKRELMRVFKDMELVEQIGSGMSRILKAYDRSIFSFTPNFLTVSFPIEEGFADNGSDGTVNGIDGIVNGTVNFSKILAALVATPQLTIEQISTSTGIAKRTVAREMKKMRERRAWSMPY